MLHPMLLAEFLDDEVAATAERLGTRAEALGHDGRYVRCRVTGADRALLWLRMDAAGYDADPVGVDVCDDAGPRWRWSTGSTARSSPPRPAGAR
jgi:hypothetical protein